MKCFVIKCLCYFTVKVIHIISQDAQLLSQYTSSTDSPMPQWSLWKNCFSLSPYQFCTVKLILHHYVSVFHQVLLLRVQRDDSYLVQGLVSKINALYRQIFVVITTHAVSRCLRRTICNDWLQILVQKPVIYFTASLYFCGKSVAMMCSYLR
jgi:hypothetical protein